MSMSTEAETQSRWYIIHAYSGQEERVKKNLDQRVASMDVHDKIFQVIVPTEEEIEIKEGRRRSVRRKVFPGYILIQMDMDDDSWHVVRNTPGVTGFISAEDEKDKRAKPVPLEPWEVANILQQIASETPKGEDLSIATTMANAACALYGPEVTAAPSFVSVSRF